MNSKQLELSNKVPFNDFLKAYWSRDFCINFWPFSLVDDRRFILGTARLATLFNDKRIPLATGCLVTGLFPWLNDRRFALLTGSLATGLFPWLNEIRFVLVQSSLATGLVPRLKDRCRSGDESASCLGLLVTPWLSSRRCISTSCLETGLLPWLKDTRFSLTFGCLATRLLARSVDNLTSFGLEGKSERSATGCLETELRPWFNGSHLWRVASFSATGLLLLLDDTSVSMATGDSALCWFCEQCLGCTSGCLVTSPFLWFGDTVLDWIASRLAKGLSPWLKDSCLCLATASLVTGRHVWLSWILFSLISCRLTTDTFGWFGGNSSVTHAVFLGRVPIDV